MTSRDRSRQVKATLLSEQGHQQVMDLLRLAEKSAHPEIRDTALDIAKRMSKHQRQQGARLSPNLILTVNLALGMAVAAVCWYAFLHYSSQLASNVSSIAIRVYFVIVAISLLLSGHLSQANFMKILGWLESQIKDAWNSIFKRPVDKRSADAERSTNTDRNVGDP